MLFEMYSLSFKTQINYYYGRCVVVCLLSVIRPQRAFVNIWRLATDGWRRLELMYNTFT